MFGFTLHNFAPSNPSSFILSGSFTTYSKDPSPFISLSIFLKVSTFPVSPAVWATMVSLRSISCRWLLRQFGGSHRGKRWEWTDGGCSLALVARCSVDNLDGLRRCNRGLEDNSGSWRGSIWLGHDQNARSRFQRITRQSGVFLYF